MKERLVDEVVLSNLLKRTSITQKNKILLILFDSSNPLSVSEIRERGKELGILEIQNWTISKLLSALKRNVTRLNSKWIISDRGREYIDSLKLIPITQQIVVTNNTLRSHLANITSQLVKDYVEEAIRCCENQCYRAAIVLAWAGAMQVLREYIVQNKLTDFNNAASSRLNTTKTNWKPANNSDELGSLTDSIFFQILDDINVIDKNTKQALTNNSVLRNSSAHPSSLVIIELQTSAFLEFLITNIFLKFC